MRIWLRPITLSDGETIVRWRNSKEVSAHCFDKRPITTASNEEFYKENIETGRYKQFIVERINEDVAVVSYPIATVYLKDFDQVNHRCEMCIFTSDDQEWNTDSQRLAIRLLLEKAFTEYDMHKVYTYVFAKNQDEIALMKSAGLKEESVLCEEAIDLNGNYVDVIRMTILASNYKRVEGIDE